MFLQSLGEQDALLGLLQPVVSLQDPKLLLSVQDPKLLLLKIRLSLH